MELLKELTDCFGVSGFEEEVVIAIKNQFKDEKVNIEQDKSMNLFVTRNMNKNYKKVLLCSHMDEVGFIVTAINDNGLLSFDVIGGVNIDLLVGKKVYIGRNKVQGIITLLTNSLKSQDKYSLLNDLYIDIGALNKEEAMKLVSKGECVTFQNSFGYLGENHIVAKALDDRVGCSLIIKLLKQDFSLNRIGCFTVQEEIGLRGAKMIDTLIHSDICIVIDCTPSFDFPDIERDEVGCTLGKGPVLNIFDSKAIYDKKVINEFINIARENKIPYQIKMKVSGSTDAAELKFKEVSLKTIVISLPCKFIHTCSTIVNLDDLKNTYLLIYYYLKSLELET